MCLEKVDAEPKMKGGVGYKVVLKKEREYQIWDFCKLAGRPDYPLTEWKEDPSPEDNVCNDGYYPCGYHICLNKDVVRRILEVNKHDYPDLVIIKCKFRKVVATGHQYGSRVAVAREIFNMGEVS